MQGLRRSRPATQALRREAGLPEASDAATSNQGGRPSPPPSDEKTPGRAFGGTGPGQSTDRRDANGPRRRWLTLLVWTSTLAFSGAVAFSHHWLADLILALLPLALMLVLSVFGVVTLLRGR